MDKNAIKTYAVWARNELRDRVSKKLDQYEITASADANADSVRGKLLTKDEKSQRAKAIEKVKDKGIDQVIEEVAYTWFNRFSALRFMEVNNYLPTRIRVFTDENNEFKPQILAEAIHMELDGLDMEKVYDLKEKNNNDELFKYLIITQCNALSRILPGMFQKIADYTELLFPDNLLREGSVIEQLISTIPEDNWTDQVQIIGWLYQYYNTEPKNDIDLKVKKGIKVSQNELPAKTQIFTPDWIVQFMVENSLGRFWVEGKGNSTVPVGWKYYIEPQEQNSEVTKIVNSISDHYREYSIENIKAIDPCQGSGHILCNMFDAFMTMYDILGYSNREAVRNIIENNLWGLDIDRRATQLAYFSLMMKARQYDSRFLSRKNDKGEPIIPQPHVYCITQSNEIDTHAVEYYCNDDKELLMDVQDIINEMRDACEYGSLISCTSKKWNKLFDRLDETLNEISIYREIIAEHLSPLIHVAHALSQKYEVVVTNPPYLGNGAMNPKLSGFVQDKYQIAKSDTFSAFILRCKGLLKPNGLCSMVTMQSWMNLGAFDKLRVFVCENTDLLTLWHLDDTLLGIAYQTAAFTFRNAKSRGFIGSYFVATKEMFSQHEEDMFNCLMDPYIASQDSFSELTGCPIAYSLGPKSIETYVSSDLLEKVLTTREGMTTGSNDDFLRLWFEIDINKKNKKWFPYNKGGEFRKWYGNDEYLVNWENDGMQIRNFKDEKTGRIRSHNYNGEYAFREGITWSAFSSRGATFRYSDSQFLFDSKGSKGFCKKELVFYILAFLNGRVGENYLSYFAGAKDKKPGHIIALPYRYSDDQFGTINTYSKNCVEIEKNDWDSFETSWDFGSDPIVRKALGYGHGNTNGSITIEYVYASVAQDYEESFHKLKENEEALNRIFIDIYGLQDELTPEVEDKDVTVRRPDRERDIKNFISYAVGCMMGRYNYGGSGLEYAGGTWDASKYKYYPADEDGIIPICDDEYFQDDIVGRFVDFVKGVFGAETLEENLKYIADSLGGSGAPREVIRNYFLNGFYADHLKMYQKRPIYWLFDSGKKNGFKCLIYMHRYKPDTIARIRTDYVHEQQSRYRTAIAGLERQIADASTSERVRLNKRLSNLKDQAEETHKYEEKIHHLADQMISIDLDDGVKHNYEIFKDVLAIIK